MVDYVAVQDADKINPAEIQKCLVPFGYRVRDRVLERPTEFEKPEYDGLSQNIEDRLREQQRKTIEDTIKGLMVERLFMKIKPEELDPTKNIFMEYGVDSVSVFEIIVGCEEVYGIQVGDNELKVGNFQDINSIAEYLRAKLGVPGKVLKTQENTEKME